jgi:GxxExxY protein
VELEHRGLQAKTVEPIKVHFKGSVVGDYVADLLVEDKVTVELKVSRQYNPTDEAQLINELKATGRSVGLLLNFGREKVEFKRMVFSNSSAFNPR